MEQRSTPNKDLENLLRKGLQQVNQSPDADTWEQIAARQHPRNTWLKIRYYGAFALPLVVLLAALGWWYYGSTTQASAPAPVEQTPGHQTAPPQTPVARAPGILLPAANEADFATPAGPAIRAVAPAAVHRTNTVPATSVRFQVGSGLDYQSPVTGTRVQIPANALTDAAGNPVSGEAELMLREYRDIADFLASGIPMHYADGRGSFFFNSGGMFEVRVVQDGQNLQMAPGQSYDVLFSPTAELSDASLYYLDEQNGAWQYQPSPAFASLGFPAGQGQPPVASENEVVRNNLNSKRQNCLPPTGELPANFDPVAWMKTGVQMGYDIASGKTSLPVWFRKRPHLSNENLLNGMEHGLIRIVRNRDQGESFFPEDVNNVFTELKAFKDCYFLRSGDSVEMTKALDPDIYWDRIAVVQEAGNQCWISLFSEKEGLMQFYATLTASIGNKAFNANRVMDEYRHMRAERQNNFEQMVKNLRCFLFMAPIFQEESEWCMGQQFWLEHFEKQHPLMAKRYGELVHSGLTTNDSLARATWENWRKRLRELYFERGERFAKTIKDNRTNLQYALKVTAFGLYNCDQIFRLGRNINPDYVYAAYQTTGGKRIYASSVSVMERNTKLFFTLPSADKIIVIPGRQLDVVVIDGDGRRYHLPGEQYARLDIRSREFNTLTVTDITDQTQTPRDWAEYLDL